jgi:hypothetical protein
VKSGQKPVSRAIAYVAAALALLAFFGFIGPLLLSSRTDEGPLVVVAVAAVVAVVVLTKIFNRSKS